MGFLRELGINAYYFGTLPARLRALRKDARLGRAAVVVLAYHRVADVAGTPWTMTHAMFERHIDWLSKHVDLISLEEAQRRIRSGRNERLSAVITFDDGYADNNARALPLLVERKIPCTYFVTLRNVLDGSPFTHDVALGRPSRPNSIEELRDWSRRGIEIGTHGFEHADMAKVRDDAEIERQIIEPKHRLEEELGRPVRYFAFPFGLYANLSSRVFQIASGGGYAGVLSAYGGYNFPGEDPFHLQRVLVDNQMARLRNRATVDPRKRVVTRFEYGAVKNLAPGNY